jgi:hypothetical protein
LHLERRLRDLAMFIPASPARHQRGFAVSA